MIMLWSGAIADIPAGYRLCDGNAGTPDLRNRFIVGAGTSYAPDDTGGANTHTHPFTSDTHDNDIPAGTGVGAGPTRTRQSTLVTDSGTTDPSNHRPTYYALAYIMKT